MIPAYLAGAQVQDRYCATSSCTVTVWNCTDGDYSSRYNKAGKGKDPGRSARSTHWGPIALSLGFEPNSFSPIDVRAASSSTPSTSHASHRRSNTRRALRIAPGSVLSDDVASVRRRVPTSRTSICLLWHRCVEPTPLYQNSTNQLPTYLLSCFVVHPTRVHGTRRVSHASNYSTTCRSSRYPQPVERGSFYYIINADKEKFAPERIGKYSSPQCKWYKRKQDFQDM